MEKTVFPDVGNPAHAKDIVYRPKKVFTDSMKTLRIYNEMWTGEWWNTVQVSVFWSFLIYTSDLIMLGGSTTDGAREIT